ncbi:MAG: hypothetical protein Q9165_006380 [Trypethelium subeluteriae]
MNKTIRKMASTKYAEDFVNFLNASPTPFHAVHSAKNLLEKAGFEHIKAIGVETYGGGLWHTWFDRDLSIAGRAMIRTKAGDFQQKLVHIKKPILRIPTLAVHLDRQENFAFNNETQLFPIAGLAAAELNRRSEDRDYEKLEKEQSDSNQSFDPLSVPSERHHPYLVELIAKEANVSASEIDDFEMVLYDTQEACIGGLNDEFIFSARLDNLGMSYCSTIGLIESLETSLDDDSTVRLIALFDHEEIGSTSAQGAGSTLLPAIIKRLCALGTSAEDNASAYEETLSKSFLVSADMSHSVHPNYPAKHESEHRSEMNKGTVIKINANVRYATNSPGIALIQEMARRAKKSSTSPSKAETGVPLQLFVGRNDTSCGSTIGPMLSAALGARTLDLGNPQLSMHSIRETGGVHDIEHSIRLFESFFSHFGQACYGLALSHLKALPKRKRLVFVSNNSTKSRQEYKKKFDSMNINCNVEEIFGSSYSAAIYISRKLRLSPPKNKVYVLGVGGVETELDSESIPHIGGTDESLRREMTGDDYEKIASGEMLDPDVGIVLTGLDFHVNYLKIALGMAYIRRGAIFLATNIDTTLPSNKTLFPGAGATSAPLIAASGKEPLALGKPSQAMMDAIEGKFKLDRKRTCMVGDRLNTDIQFGIEGGLGGTLLVLTGVSTKEDLLGGGKEVVPMAYVDKLADLASK